MHFCRPTGEQAHKWTPPRPLLRKPTEAGVLLLSPSGTGVTKEVHTEGWKEEKRRGPNCNMTRRLRRKLRAGL